MITKRMQACAQLSSITSQLPLTTTPVPVTYDAHDLLSGVTHTLGTSQMIIEIPGLYLLAFGGQVSRTSGAGGVKIADYWLRKNGVDVPNSSVRISLLNVNDTSVLMDTFVLELGGNDILQVVQAVESATIGLGLTGLPGLAGGPWVPAIIVSLTRIRI